MPRYSNEEMKEYAPKTVSVGFLQIKHYRCTQEREAIAKILESNRRIFTAKELAILSKLTPKTVHRILKTFEKEDLCHFSPRFKGYFACQKLMQSRRKKSCHSYAICKNCKKVSEWVHEKHLHPRVNSFKLDEHLHEWLGLCESCTKAS